MPALSLDDFYRLIESPAKVDYFERAARGRDPWAVAQWVNGIVARTLKARGETFANCKIAPELLGKLIDMTRGIP